jgi:galactose oxidase-like protein
MSSMAPPRGARALLALAVASCSTTNPTAPPAAPSPVGSPSAPVGTATPTSGPAASAPASGTWARVGVDGDGPPPREDHTWTVAEDGRTAWLFGGRDGGTVYDDVWSFDLDTETWSREAIDGPGPPGRFGHEAAWLPGVGVLIWAGQAGADFFDDLWLLDPERRSWTLLDTIGEVPDARYGSCSGVGPDGRLWVSHGFTENGVRFDDTRSFDFADGRWTDLDPAGAIPVKRCLHACWWTLDGRLALYGGQNNRVPALGDLWFLRPGASDLEAPTWTESPGQAAPARQLPAVARIGLLTVIVGGRDTDGEPLGDAWILVDGSMALAPLHVAAPPPARSGAALVHDARGDRLVMFGGRGGVAFGDVWELTFP